MKKRETEGAFRADIFDYANKKQGTMPEFLWIPFPNYAVLRRPDNKKWYAIVMDVPKNKLGLKG